MKPIKSDETTGGAASIEVEIVTPEGVVIPIKRTALQSGMHTGSYTLGRIVSTGKWELVSRLISNPQESFSAKFEVKKYVLPSYEVKVTSETSFYYYDADSFTVSVKATYLFGKEVNGMAYVVFGAIIENSKKAFPSSLQRITVNDGNGEATLQKADILKTFPNIEDLVGRSLFVSATVYTESGSEMVVGELRNIQIVQSPYFISFDKTPKYFIPRTPFTVTVTVTNPDGTPAKGIPVLVGTPGDEKVRGTTGANGRASLNINHRESDSSLTITAITNVNNLPDKRQTSKSMVAKPHQSKNQNFININVMTELVEVGTNLNAHLGLSQQSGGFDITYLILSRGQLVDFGRQSSVNQNIIALVVPVTKKMLPSFRLIVYYHPTAEDIVSNSVWVDVEDSCVGTFKLEPKKPATSYMPRQKFSLKVTGEPGATVGLVAVDKGVYVLSKKHLLTQKKVWEIVEKADTGCTPGGGKNSMGVFFDAGLMFHTDTAGGTPYRQEVKCPRPSARERRAGTLLDAITTLASKYKDPLERECCQDGMKSTPLSYTCAQRTLYITDGKACEDAFLFCCEELKKQHSDLKQNTLLLARSEENNDHLDNNDITPRTQFPESWQWQTYTIPLCDRDPNCKENTLDIDKLTLKDSITTWVFTGISVSENSGICVGKPLDMVVFKSFFIDLRLPYSAVVGEQIEIRAILHNYIDTEDPVTVRIELFENTDVCSSAWKRGTYMQLVKIGPSTTHAVSFVIVPMKEGQVSIRVRAIARGWDKGDEITKQLRVVPKGVLTNVKRVFDLDPKDGTRTINNGIQRSKIFPNTPSSTRAFVTGRENISPLVETVIGASSMGSMIRQPTGCGEQNMYYMSLTVITTTYLDKTNQWEAVGLGKRGEALTHIQTGFKNEMEYAKTDGSFSVWTHEPSSIWLTAYVVKIFSMASNLVTIEEKSICDAVTFLIRQAPEGIFKEIGPIYHPEYTGDVLGRESDASMTAFCLIAMQESQHICSHLVNNFDDAIAKSVVYLEKRLPSLTSPYAVAITSYALANADKLDKEILYNFVSPEMTHWTSPRGHVFSLEATAYALLALVKGQYLEDARPIVRWFTRQQKVGGGYGSTQATVIVYQAVSEYWAAAKEPDYNLLVEMKVPGRTAPYSYRLTRDDQHTTRTTHKFTDINENVTVIARGTGEAKLTLITQYYAIPKETVSDCKKFKLSVDFSLDKVDVTEGDIYKLRMEFSFKSETEDGSMSVLDIAIPTGFIPMNEDLNALSEGRAAVISKWEDNKDLSDTGSIIIYLKKVARSRVEELAFRMRQIHKVGVLQPASVSIYEYYDETKCVKYYHPQRKSGGLVRRCKGDVCLCAEENCSMQQKDNISKQQRLNKACQADPTATIDYVYQVILKEADYDVLFDTYDVQIQTVIKEGTDKVAQDQRRNFTSLSHCRESLNLQLNKEYLIMGTVEKTQSSTQPFEYWLGEKTWIEYWPSGEECQTDEHRQTCLGMEDLVDKMESHGCRF